MIPHHRKKAGTYHGGRRHAWILVLIVTGGIHLGGCGGGGGTEDADATDDDGRDADVTEEAEAEGPGDPETEQDVEPEADAEEDVADVEEEEVATCGFSVPVPISELNTPTSEMSPDISADGLTLYYSTSLEGGLGDRDIWFATRSITDIVFGDPVNLVEINSEGGERGPSISPDGLTIYFTTDKTGGAGNGDIWVATRSVVTEPFGEPVNVVELNTTSTDGAPFVTADGLTIFFTSDRPGTVGQLDTWVATRSEVSEPFGEVTNIAELNTTSHDSGPVLTQDGLTIVFSSTRPGGAGEYDLWIATRTDTESAFGEPQNLEALNTAYTDDSPGLSPDGRGIYFCSDRPGGEGELDLYFSYWTCPD